MSKLIESLRDDLAELHAVGAIDKVTMCEFDAIFPPPARNFLEANCLNKTSHKQEPTRTQKLK